MRSIREHATEPLRAIGGRIELGFLHSTHRETEFRDVLTRMYRESPQTTAHFNLARPEPRQRNRALLMDDLVRLTGNASPRALGSRARSLGARIE